MDLAKSIDHIFIFIRWVLSFWCLFLSRSEISSVDQQLVGHVEQEKEENKNRVGKKGAV